LLHCQLLKMVLSLYTQFVTLALVLSTRQCRHSSLYYQECNELLIIFYIIYVTSHTLSLFGQTILDEIANRLSTYQRRIRTYRVIHKSLRDFRPLRYSSRDAHAEGEHVNRGRDTPSFCPTLQVLDMLTSEGS